MRMSSILRPLTLAVAFGVACSPLPTGNEIQSSLDAQLKSVQGNWVAIVPDQSFTLSYQLSQASGGQVSGTGTMQERNAPSTTPVTVVGYYQRPDLTLTFGGMVMEGHHVRGDFHGQYTTVAGIGDTLVITGVGGDTYTKRTYVLLQASQ
ncbi:MAG: hypothetical protein M3R65_10220 [Gemmatimonadota bacterium]|nr:hypothetical protein [Gemmatimonadota bacterium]